MIEPFGIGDLLFVTPVLRALRCIPGMERVDLLLGSRTQAMVETNPHVNDIYVINKDDYHKKGWRYALGHAWGLGRVLRRQRYDLVLDYSLQSEYSFMAWLLGIPYRAAFDYKRRAFFSNYRLPLPEGFWGRSVIDFFAELLEQVSVPVRDRRVEIYLTAEDKQEASAILQKEGLSEKRVLLMLAPGGGASWGKDAAFKQWPAASFAKLIETLKEKIDIEGLVILGSAEEFTLGETVRSGVSLPATNLCGKVGIRTAAALLRHGKLFLGNDGGLVHMAHGLGVPVLAFYGPVSPEVYGPFPKNSQALSIYKDDLTCRPCYYRFRYKSNCQDKACLQNLTPDEVLQKIEAAHYFQNLQSLKSHG